MSTKDKILQQLEENPIILYMKGSPANPSCGFSAKASSVLSNAGYDYAYVDILASPFIMEALPSISDFPTFPQLFIKGKIIGGSDIVEEMINKGELQPMLDAAIQ